MNWLLLGQDSILSKSFWCNLRQFLRKYNYITKGLCFHANIVANYAKKFDRTGSSGR